MDSSKSYHPKLELNRLTRYVSFAKYLDFLCNGLFCAKVSLFDDPWEGHVFHSITAKAENRLPLAAVMNHAKNWIHASCWHAANHESYAMWRIYGQLSEAVAIHSTVARLKELMAKHYEKERDPVALLTPVQYVSPTEGGLPKLDASTIYAVSYHNPKDQDRVFWLNIMQNCFGTKPTAYEYEDEVRLLILDQEAPKFFEQTRARQDSDKVGKYVRIDDYKEFLTDVTVAPSAPDWFIQVLRRTNEVFGLSEVPVDKSRMFDAPQVPS